MRSTNPVSGPYTHSGGSVTSIMFTVLMALLPALFFGIYLFGWPALILLLTVLFSVILAEAVCLKLANKAVLPGIADGSAILTACLLTMSLPPWAPWWVGVFGGVFGIVIGKHIFGGTGQNLFNPAMLARVALLVAFPLEMTTWTKPAPLFSDSSPDMVSAFNIIFNGASDIDSVSSATVLGFVKTGFTQHNTIEMSLQALDYNLLSSVLGNTAGSFAETSALLVFIGGALLLLKRIISWHIPIAMLGTLALLATLFNYVDPARYANALVHVFSGGAMLCAFFIATDPVTSPSSKKGQLVFGSGCGALDYIIRTWGGYPEGVGFAILLMNALTPLIDYYIRPRIYGRDAKGKPLSIKPATPSEENRHA